MEGLPLPKYRLALLGCFELTGPDGPVALPNKKLAALLAYLAYTAPEPQSREKLANLLWGSHFDTQAQQNLRQALYRLRQALGEHALIGDADKVWLAPSVFDCDVARFEALITEDSRASLAEAVDLYEERLLADVAIEEEAWVDWVAGERRRLEELALDALVRLGEIELAAGETNKALETAHRVLAINNLREDAHRLIIQALAGAGRKAEAIKHYQDFAALLKRELNVEPDAATKSLAAELCSTQTPSRSPTLKEIAKTVLPQPDRPSVAAFADTREDPEHKVSGNSPAARDDAASSLAAAHPSDPERRQLTIMVCQTVGSMLLSGGLDPEDMRELIAPFHKVAADVVARFDGFVAQYLSSGVVVYFGYPAAHEDDAERAVRAGLAILDAVGTLKAVSGVPFQVRAGIATGVVVIGGQVGTGDTRQPIAIGETPNLALQLQGMAQPNGVVIAESTRKLIGNLFELDDLGAQDLKGLAGSVRAWTALRPAFVESRFEALHASGLTELVGREEELEILLRRWSKAKSGEGQVVLLSGEAGIGKSRLTAALLERLVGEPHTRLRYFCSPQHTDSAFFPIIRQMERAAGFTHTDTGQAKLDKLDAVLALASTSKQDAALFADLLSLPNDGRYPALELTPQQRRQKTLEALGSQLVALSRSRPVLMIFEDTYWADPTSLEALGRAVDRTATHPVMLVITFRPEFEPPWIGQPHVTALTINRLTRHEVEAMIDRVAGNKLVPADIRQDIIERTDGIPLFVEEMTKAVLEAESQRAAERAAAAIPSPAVAVPASLHASLMARLDRLGPAKEVAQIGAAVGREFSHALLAAVMGKPEAELQSALDRLVAAGLLFLRGASPQAAYLFKHALVQDAAYGTLLREPRRALHSRIAETLESGFPEIAENQPEVLARHCTEAGLIEKAASVWGKAGQRSIQRSALIEGVAQLTRALDQIASLPSTPALRREEIKLQVALITPLMHVKGYAASETKAAAERARLLIERAEGVGEPQEDPLLLFSVLYGFWVANYFWFNGDTVCDLAAHFLTLAEKQTATAPLVVGHRLMGTSLLSTGDPTQGRTHLDRALALYNPVEHAPLATRFGQDAKVSILSYRALALLLLGYPDTALKDADGAVEYARDIGQAATLMYALYKAWLVNLECGNYEAVKAYADELFTLADEKSVLFWKTCGILARGGAFALKGSAAEAVETISSGIAAWRATESTMWLPSISAERCPALPHRLLPLYTSLLATAHAGLGQFDDAWRCIGEAIGAITTTKEKWFEAEANRVAGEIALKSPEPDASKAETCFERALTIARKQQAKFWELRAAISMARLWCDQGKLQQARKLLAPVYGWFTEGFDTRDLKDAKALLEKLQRARALAG